MKPHAKGLLWLLAAGLFSLLLVIGLPLLGKWIPWSFEKKIASSLGSPVEQSICSAEKNAQARKLFDRLIQRVFPVYPQEAKDLPITVHVIEGTTVNAFTWLGGDIYVYEGLIKQAESAEELAAVIAHEIEHAKRRHILQRALIQLITYEAFQLVFGSSGSSGPQVTSMLLNLKFSREQEREADEGGLKRLERAHIDASGFQKFFERMQKKNSVPAVFSDHPADEDRAAYVKGMVQKDVRPIMSQADWKTLQGICKN